MTARNIPLMINGRNYAWPKNPVVVVCIDGSEPAYIEEAIKAGFLDMAVSQEKVLVTALGYADKLKMLPRASFAEAKLALRKETLEKMKQK